MKPPKALSYIIKRSNKYSPIIIFTGNTQIGKSTVSWYLANKILQVKNKIKKLTFDEWDYKKYSAQNLEEFVKMVDKYDNELLCIEEAGFQLDAKEWYSKENKIFNKILQTQAYKHNIYFIVLPYACGIAKDHRRMIDMLFWIKRKITQIKTSLIYPVLIRKQYWKLDETGYKPFFFPKILIKYNKKVMQKANEYTNWLIDYKKAIMKDIKTQIGIATPVEFSEKEINELKPVKMKNPYPL